MVIPDNQSSAQRRRLLSNPSNDSAEMIQAHHINVQTSAILHVPTTIIPKAPAATTIATAHHFNLPPDLKKSDDMFVSSKRGLATSSHDSRSTLDTGRSSIKKEGLYKPLGIAGMTAAGASGAAEAASAAAATSPDVIETSDGAGIENVLVAGGDDAGRRNRTASLESIQLDLLPSLSLETLQDIQKQQVATPTNGDNADEKGARQNRKKSAAEKVDDMFAHIFGLEAAEYASPDTYATKDGEDDLSLSINGTYTLGSYEDFVERDENGMEDFMEIVDCLTCGKFASPKDDEGGAAGQDDDGIANNDGGGEGGIGRMMCSNIFADVADLFHCLGFGDHAKIEESTSADEEEKRRRRKEQEEADRAIVESHKQMLAEQEAEQARQLQLQQQQKRSVPTIEELYRQCIKLLSQGRYEKLVQICRACPAVLTFRAPVHGMTTVVHVLARSERTPKAYVVLQALGQDVSCVAIPDREGNLPLHTLMAHWGSTCNVPAQGGAGGGTDHVDGTKLGLLGAMLKIFPGAAAIQNVKGQLPLHVLLDTALSDDVHLLDDSVVAAAVVKLLEANSRSVDVKDNVEGWTPLHLAFARGSSCSVEIIKAILETHKKKKIGIATVDNNGNTPLHLAIRSGASHEAIDAILSDVNDTFLGAYLQQDGQGDLPLHTVLRDLRTADRRLIEGLIKSSPYAATCPNAAGHMPIALATGCKADDELVRTLLKADMPIEIGSHSAASNNGIILEKQHGHSWWHVAIDCQDRYIDMIDDVLSSLSLAEVIALIKTVGPDCATTTRKASPPQLASLFRERLGFLDRYELIGETKWGRTMIATDAIDRGYGPSNTEIPDGVSALLYEGGLGFSELSRQQQQNACNDAEEFEIALAPSENEAAANQEGQVVSLCCYEREDDYKAEIDIRRILDATHTTPSSTFFQTIVDCCERISGAGSTTFHCIAFERQSFTLAEMLDEPENESGITWLTERRQLLKQIGRAVRFLHKGGFVHGNLTPENIAKFGEQWKLTNVGQTVALGSTISGPFRRYAPPEHLIDPISSRGSEVDKLANQSPDRLDTFAGQKRHVPRRCIASAAWDTFSYGEIMAQVLLSDESIALPVHEKDDTAIMERLARFGKDDIKNISEEVCKTAGELPSDLIIRLLEPNPAQRLSSMSKVLSHRYFHDEIELLAQPEPQVYEEELTEQAQADKETAQEVIEETQVNDEIEREIVACPSLTETEIVVNSLDSLTKELKALTIEIDMDDDDIQSQTPSAAASVAHSTATEHAANTCSVKDRHRELRIPPTVPQSPYPQEGIVCQEETSPEPESLNEDFLDIIDCSEDQENENTSNCASVSSSQTQSKQETSPPDNSPTERQESKGVIFVRESRGIIVEEVIDDDTECSEDQENKNTSNCASVSSPQTQSKQETSPPDHPPAERQESKGVIFVRESRGIIVEEVNDDDTECSEDQENENTSNCANVSSPQTQSKQETSPPDNSPTERQESKGVIFVRESRGIIVEEVIDDDTECSEDQENKNTSNCASVSSPQTQSKQEMSPPDHPPAERQESKGIIVEDDVTECDYDSDESSIPPPPPPPPYPHPTCRPNKVVNEENQSPPLRETKAR